MKELLAAARAMPPKRRAEYQALWMRIYTGPRVEAANRIKHGVNSGYMYRATEECREIVLGMLVSKASLDDTYAVAAGYYEALTG